MAQTVAETIRAISRNHLTAEKGLILGQCLTAVGWVGGTVPELTEDEGIVELSMADSSGPGIAVGAALAGRRPIYVIRYQGFLWYNAAPLLNYAAKSKEMWGVPCPLLIRAIAMEGGIGPVAAGSHHGMVMRMPGLPVCAPMTPNEWRQGWDFFLQHDDPLFMSEHRKSYARREEMADQIQDSAKVTVLAISAGRLSALEATANLQKAGLTCDLFHIVWLKPFAISTEMTASLKKTGLGVIVDSDYSISGPARSIAYELMHKTGAPVHAFGLDDRTAGFAPHLDNVTPTTSRIERKILELLQGSHQEPIQLGTIETDRGI